MKIYTIIWIMKLDSLYSMEPIGNYTDMETALAHVSKLEELWSTLGHDKYEEAIFDIIDFELDETPYLLDYLTKAGTALTDGVSDQLIKLMGEGLVDQLVGEDGNFYYRLTDSGKKNADKSLKNITKWKKFLDE